jgi:hypothetical protein
MRISSLRLGLGCAAVVLAAAASAQAQFQVIPFNGYEWQPGGAPRVVPAGSTYNVFTGVATSAGSLALLEDTTTPVRDDVVAFDGAPELINDYVAAAGSVVRSQVETDVDNGNGTHTTTFTVTGTLPAGGPGDLWPAGFSSGGTPLPNGGFGLGLALPASVGGTDPVNWQLGDSILSANVAISTNGVFAAPLNLPSTFFGSPTYPAPAWNGQIGISFTNGATGTAIQDGIRLSITYAVPEPASLSLLSVGALGMLRRRRD